MIVAVPERGSTLLNVEQWASLSSDHRFWQLVSSNIIGIESGGAGRWMLKGSCYVGRALIGDTLLEVSEKFSNSFETLVGLGALKAPKTLHVTSPVSPSAGSTAILVSLFLQAVRTYLSGNKRSVYTQVPDAGALIGGRLSVKRTIRLRTRGASHQAAFDRPTLSADVPFNRCLYAALREVERLSKVTKISASDVATARALRLGLSECLPSVLMSYPGELSEIASREAMSNYANPQLHNAISLAGAVLDAAGFGGAEAWKRSVERSWFVNLETFFEEAVRRSVQAALSGSATVCSAKQRPNIFRPRSHRYRANPDLVISNHQTGAVVIGDAKYKDFSDWPSQSDVYELIAHASAYGAGKALLFYPSEREFISRHLGLSTTGCDVWAFGISFGDFAGDIRSALEISGQLPVISKDAKVSA